VASAADGPSTLWDNPAGVVESAGDRAELDLFVLFLSARYTNDASGYDGKSSETAYAPNVWVASDRLSPWHVGAGVYGTVGAAFSFPGNAAAGFPNRFLSEFSAIHVGLVAGREVMTGLRVGVQAAPTYGTVRVRAPTPLGPMAFDVDGFGIVGAVGLQYDVDPSTAVGVSYRPEGIVWMSGDAHVAGMPYTVDFDFHTPQMVRFGVARSLGQKLTLLASARWVDYPRLEDDVFDFRTNDALDQPFVAAARDQFRYGAALEWAATEAATLRCGVSREEWMMEPSSLGPLLFDTTDVLFGVGFAADFEPWRVEMVGGLPLIEDRRVSAAENPSFPGRYQSEGGVFGIAAAYRF
jgi:long-chain fatty acid transport protein